MTMKINSYVPINSHLRKVEIFGYTSKGQPGLEILGIGNRGRTLKEKIIYLSKRRNLKFNLLRYVLCVEADDISKGDLNYLELPLLICFWTMAGILKFGRLDNCLCAGKVSLEGEVYPLNFSGEVLENWNKCLWESGRMIMILAGSSHKIGEYKQIQYLDLEELLNESVTGFKVVA